MPPPFSIGLGLDLRLGGGVSVDPETGLSLTPDYWVDATNGNDANAGTSEGAAWKTLSKISSFALPAGATRVVRVKAGTYSNALDYVLRSDAVSGGAAGANSHLKIVYEPGCVLDGTATLGQNGHEFSGTNTYYTTIYGNGVQVRNYSEATAASPNGFGNRNTHQLTVYRAHCINCDDGFSAHGSATLNLYDCSAQGSEKSPFVHVDTSIVNAYRCEFYAKSGTTLTISGGGTPVMTCEDCKFIPATAGQSISMGLGTYTRCQIGTLALRMQILGVQSVVDSFVHAYIDGNATGAFTKCYGYFSTRARNGGNVDVNRCIWGGPTAAGAMVFQNFNYGSAAKLQFNNSICKASSAANFMSLDATNAGYLVAAASEFFNNAMAGSSAYDADLIAADTGGTVIVGTVTANPLIGAANTLDPDDYGYAAGSPCIGAGVGGANIGFAVGEVDAPEPIKSAVPAP